MNFKLNKRKSKKAAGASPQAPLGELSALPQTPLLSREGARPPYPPPVVNIFIRPLLSQNPGSAPGIPAFRCSLSSAYCFLVPSTIAKCKTRVMPLATIMKILTGRLRLFKVSNNRLKRLFSRNTTSWGGYLILAIG